MRFIACGASVAGPRHADLGEASQDAMVLAGYRGGWIFAAADGLGSRPHSDQGAHSACLVTRRVLRVQSQDFDFSDALSSIHKQWLEAIDPRDPSDAATTLLLGRVTADGHFHTAQLGDGMLLARCNGEFRCITPERVAYGNQTWALESMHLQSKWNTFTGRFTKPGDGVVLMTDGISDDLEPSNLNAFFNALYKDLCNLNRRRGRSWLQSELKDWTTPLHGDDKTLVAVFRKSK